MRNRRTLLSGVAGCCVLQSQLWGRQARGPVQSAVATLCCDGFGDEDFKYAFEAIPELGVKNVEFNCWYARNLTTAGLASIKRRCDARGLKAVSLQASSFGGGGNHEIAKEVSRLLWLLEACERLGCKLLKCTGARRGQAGGLESLVQVLNAVAPEAERRGIRIVLENHHRNVLEFPDDYDYLFSKMASSAVGMCFDMGHFARSGVDLTEVIEQFHSRIYEIDVKDADAVGGRQFVRFGTGIVDCAAVIEQCIDRGYSGYLVLELSLIDRATMLEDLRAGLEITQRFERGGA